METKPSRSGHLSINGLNLYHEVHGELDGPNPPLLLIPGAFMAADSMPDWVEAFARERAVVVFDQQGHGRTSDTSRECHTSSSPTTRQSCCARWESSAQT